MKAVSICKLPDKALRALKVRAAKNGRSVGAEIQAILLAVVRPVREIKIGTELAAFGDKYKLELEILREEAHVRPATF